MARSRRVGRSKVVCADKLDIGTRRCALAPLDARELSHARTRRPRRASRRGRGRVSSRWTTRRYPNRSPAQPVEPLFGIRLRGFQPLPKGTLIGFADIELLGGLLVHDCPVFCDGAWAALRAKPAIDRDGKQKADVNGERQFVPMFERCSRELADRFSAAVVALIEQACPDALNMGGDG
jgi:hypothetical protein